MHEFTIEFFSKESGEQPPKDFVLSLDPKMKAKTLRGIEYLREKGPMADKDVSRHLEDGIFELRTQQGNNICRVLYFFYYNKTIVFTNGFIKKTQKTPRKEIELAKKRRKEYCQRRAKEDEKQR